MRNPSLRPILAAASILLSITTTASADTTNETDAWFEAIAAHADAQRTSTDDWLSTLEQVSRSTIRHLPVSRHDLQLQGEHAILRIPLYFTRAEASRINEFRVALAAAISALPQASSLAVSLNGNHIGSVNPDPNGTATLRVPVSPGQLMAGFNELMFVARHQHRVDCSPEGTYELWSQIIPEQTGFLLTETDEDITTSSLPMILGRNEAPNTLKVRLPRDFTADAATQLSRLTNVLVLHGWLTHPKVILSEEASNEPGVEVKILPRLTNEIRETLRPIAGFPSLYVETSSTGKTRAIALVGEPEEVDAALERFEAMTGERPAGGSYDGQAALISTFGRTLTASGNYTFSDLAVETTSFVGRRFTLDVPVLLPGDYYQADYGSVHLYLNGRFAPNLNADSRLYVKVNGVEAVALRLHDSWENVFDKKEVRIPLKLFHAGMNVLTLEADLRTENDELCEPEHAIVRSPRLLLEDTSRIVVPNLARVGVVPNLAATFSHGFPYTMDSEPTDIFIVGDKRAGFATALPLLATMTANAQRIERYSVSLRSPDENESGMLVGPTHAMPGWAQTLLGTKVDSEESEPSILFDGPIANERGTSEELLFATNTNNTPNSATPLRFHLSPADESESLSSAAEPLVRLAQEAREFVRTVSGDGIDGVTEELLRIGDMLAPDEIAEKPRRYLADDIVMAQSAHEHGSTMDRLSAAVLKDAPPPTWTVVAAPNPDSMIKALDGFDPVGVPFSPKGQYYVFNETRDRMSVAGSSGQLYATLPLSPGNLRLVLAAWLSSNVGTYIVIVLSLLVAFGGLTYLSVNRRRER